MAKLLCATMALLVVSAMCQTTTYREGEQKISQMVHSAVGYLVDGLAASAYGTFHSYIDSADIVFTEIRAESFSQEGTSQVSFSAPRKVIADIPKSCLCVNFAAVLVYNWFVLSTSAYATFTTCAGCSVTLDFGDNPVTVGGAAVVSKLAATYTTTNVKLANWAARAMGLETKLANALVTSPNWGSYVDGFVQSSWNRLSAPLLNASYSEYKIEADYDAGRVGYSLRYFSAQSDPNRKLLELAYGVPTSFTTSLAPGPAMEHSFSAGAIARLYSAATSSLVWSFNLTQESLPESVTVRLDTKTFAQAVPDLIFFASPRNLTARVELVRSQSVSASITEKKTGLKISDVRFKITVLDWESRELIHGEIKVSSEVSLRLTHNGSVLRLVPRVTGSLVDVISLTCERYRSVVRPGLKRIAQELLDEYFAEMYKDRTLGSGIVLSTFSEKVDVERSTVGYEDSVVRVRVYYP